MWKAKEERTVREIKHKTYEFIVHEIREYVVQGDGSSKLEAEQDAIERFHRLNKSKELDCVRVSKPRITKQVK